MKIRLRKTYPVPVEVKLAGSDKPAAGAMVAASELNAANKLSAATGMEFTDEKGLATLRLPAGNFKVHAAYEGTPSSEVSEVEITVSPTPRTTPLMLQAPAPAKGKNLEKKDAWRLNGNEPLRS